jgi:hypothetical protein
MSEIILNQATHEYSVDGIARPGVTSILASAGLIDDRWFTDESRHRGKAVHAACHYMDEGDLPDAWMDSSPYAGYVRGWEKFRNESGFVPDTIEERVSHQFWGYCGTLDRRGHIGTRRILLDIKTGQSQYWHACQLRAYSECFGNPRQYELFTVHLGENGSYSVAQRPYAFMQAAGDAFWAALTIYQFKHWRKNGIASSNVA